MSTLQVRVDDSLKKQADELFASLGMDTSTAIRIFLTASVENDGIPFPVQHAKDGYDYSFARAVADSRSRTNLYGPYASAQEAVESMLED